MRADVVVVGAGAAGCVVAARLSERPGRTVVLLEAGPSEPVTAWSGLVASRTWQQEAAPYLQGFGVGGSAAINAMVAMVGEPDDYDEWERVYGCPGWAWRDVRPWFGRAALPMRRPRHRELGPLSAAVLSSAPTAERARLTRGRDGGRASVNEIYLDRARARHNLHVRPNSLVDRVLFDGRRAIGVVLAGGEVVEGATIVVCAGALQTPAVLLRSGADREGIGRGLHDHPSLSVPLVPRSVAVGQTTLAISVVVRGSHVNQHDLQVLPFESVEGPSLIAAAMRAHSRGRVRIAGPDPTTNPIVEFNLLDDERDMALLRAAAHVAASTAGQRVVAGIATAADAPATADELLRAVGDYFHAAGSCRMGAPDDPMAVVDTRCRVIGYESLIVCDASVMPNLPRANPCLPTVMIAERVSAMIDKEVI